MKYDIAPSVNRLDQARYYMVEIVIGLANDPQVCEGNGNYQGKLVFPYGWTVVFPNITRKQWNELLSEHEQELILPANEIAVICFHGWQGDAVSKKLSKNAINHLWMGTSLRKKVCDPALEKSP